MSEQLTWVVHFYDNRVGREGSITFDNERDFLRRIKAIKDDRWLTFRRGVRPDGSEIGGWG